jgi:hypothetical protein
MSIIPLDFQRRCDQRWAAKLARPAESVATSKPGTGEGEPADRPARQEQK